MRVFYSTMREIRRLGVTLKATLSPSPTAIYHQTAMGDETVLNLRRLTLSHDVYQAGRPRGQHITMNNAVGTLFKYTPNPALQKYHQDITIAG